MVSGGGFLGNTFESFGPLMVSQLRDQVNALMAAASLLAPLTEQEGNDRYHTYLSIINKNLYQMLRLTANIELTALPSEEPPQKVAVDLAEFCRTLCREISSIAPMMEVTFTYEETKNILLTTGVPSLLERMILNLVSNAIKAAGKGGQVGLKLSATKSHAMLTIWDNGQGVPFQEDALPQLDPATGLGLGLEVSRQVTFLHQGTLLFDQKEGQGGRAVVSLPIVPPTGDTALSTPYDATGGLPSVLVEFSTLLPSEAFSSKDLE